METKMNAKMMNPGDSPLEILLRREAIDEAVCAVRSLRKYRPILKRRWWKDYISYRLIGSKLPANGN